MWYNYKGDILIKRIMETDINYVDYGEGKNTVVLLHGWGQNIEMMKPIGDKIIVLYKQKEKQRNQ